MVNEHYQKMLGAKNRIRVLAEFATKRKREVGEENVFDFSLGNPSLPVPREFTQEM
ncbi:MAG: pyridoxal phosphate-dependent aminotransferase, partial [Lachnospiraceae bacterium]|nr:pyridoxal phosphate-dependent aminotransferase [Lachnospiraceae bacterium]